MKIIKEIDRQLEAFRKSKLEIQERVKTNAELKKGKCDKCGREMNGVFSQFFTNCNTCWGK
jgi:hypothetical protein